MKLPLLLTILTFCASFFVHVLIWRLLKPKQYLIWLPSIFLLSPVLFASACLLWIPYIINNIPVNAAICSGILYALLVVCYTGGYAGIVEYSPSAEILRSISKYPSGICIDELAVPTLDETALTGKRVRHLEETNLIVCHEGHFRLTPTGLSMVRACEFYRWLFGITHPAGG